jgi:hypothetical protein
MTSYLADKTNMFTLTLMNASLAALLPCRSSDAPSCAYLLHTKIKGTNSSSDLNRGKAKDTRHMHMLNRHWHRDRDR